MMALFSETVVRARSEKNRSTSLSSLPGNGFKTVSKEQKASGAKLEEHNNEKKEVRSRSVSGSAISLFQVEVQSETLTFEQFEW